MKKPEYQIVLHPGYTEAEYNEYLGEEEPHAAGVQEYLDAFRTIMMRIFIGFLKVLLFFINENIQYKERKERVKPVK